MLNCEEVVIVVKTVPGMDRSDVSLHIFEYLSFSLNGSICFSSIIASCFKDFVRILKPNRKWSPVCDRIVSRDFHISLLKDSILVESPLRELDTSQGFFAAIDHVCE